MNIALRSGVTPALRTGDGDARVQQRVPAQLRATTMGVRAFFAGLIRAAFITVGALARGEDPSNGLGLAMGVLPYAAVLISFTRPAARPEADWPAAQAALA